MEFNTVQVGKIVVVSIILLIVTFFPGLFSVISEDGDEFNTIGAFPKAWTWSLKDIRLSLLEVGCALPLSHCEWRPYHRRILSYFLCNIFAGIVCAAFFYPAYIYGYLLPLPSLSYYPIIRIGRWDIMH